jgi:hypothetical protein
MPIRSSKRGYDDVDRAKRRRHQEEVLDDALKNTFPASDPVSIVISEEKRMRPESASGTHRPGSAARGAGVTLSPTEHSA